MFSQCLQLFEPEFIRFLYVPGTRICRAFYSRFSRSGCAVPKIKHSENTFFPEASGFRW
ncbi:hypothetical protein L21SP2_3418 [Salinispira pacifica]|uniref:Uncharacterized protein n=1 Tax=Salinispira pacifica TaxID=1307761 RepID=V5WNT2_9SPIO|nr:hypothetical protein L21SP2_3418 [Salinispira pacifica]